MCIESVQRSVLAFHSLVKFGEIHGWLVFQIPGPTRYLGPGAAAPCSSMPANRFLFGLLGLGNLNRSLKTCNSQASVPTLNASCGWRYLVVLKDL